MNLQVMLSAMHLEDENYIDSLNICSDAIVINQCDKNSQKEVRHKCIDGVERDVIYVETTDRGLSKSRNMALAHANADVCIFCDNDVEYEDGYENMILSAFEKYVDADAIVFYIKRPEKPEPNYAKPRKMDYLSVLKIFSPEIAFRRESLGKIRFNELFGAGAKYPMGEENLFLYDCLKSGLKIMYVPTKIATLRDEESTWFMGYTEKFFITRGANYGAMSKWFSHVLIWQFALRKKSLYGENMSTIKAIATMYKGRSRYFKEIKGIAI